MIARIRQQVIKNGNKESQVMEDVLNSVVTELLCVLNASGLEFFSDLTDPDNSHVPIEGGSQSTEQTYLLNCLNLAFLIQRGDIAGAWCMLARVEADPQHGSPGRVLSELLAIRSSGKTELRSYVDNPMEETDLGFVSDWKRSNAAKKNFLSEA